MNETTPSKNELRRLNRIRRDNQIRQDFQDLYEQQRIRIDDCLKQLSEKYFLAERTISDIVFSKE